MEQLPAELRRRLDEALRGWALRVWETREPLPAEVVAVLDELEESDGKTVIAALQRRVDEARREGVRTVAEAREARESPPAEVADALDKLDETQISIASEAV